jgi:hypothetical protein
MSSWTTRLRRIAVGSAYAKLVNGAASINLASNYLHRLAFEPIGNLLECSGLLVLDRPLDKLLGEEAKTWRFM